jgi:hypothetical protein
VTPPWATAPPLPFLPPLCVAPPLLDEPPLPPFLPEDEQAVEPISKTKSGSWRLLFVMAQILSGYVFSRARPEQGDERLHFIPVSSTSYKNNLHYCVRHGRFSAQQGQAGRKVA